MGLTWAELGFTAPFNREIPVENMHHELHRYHHTAEDLEYCLLAGMNPNGTCFYGWPTATQTWGETLAFSYARSGNRSKLELLARFGANLSLGQIGVENPTSPLGLAHRLEKTEVVDFLKKSA